MANLDSIGPYRLERRIGRGGMGEVFLATRADGTFEQRVALKRVHRSADGDSIARRFHSERQILARLDHPNIARLLDGGTAEDGRPYLVMEYIEGQRLDHYADAHQLTVEARLDLFLEVCAAVQAAHQSLVVHRDLKPANILVTPDGRPKLLDFGIAKLLAPELFPHTVELTRTGNRPLTPQYASPEQLLGQPITTASDVYSLGVLLYKVLSGYLPREWMTLDPLDIRRTLDEEEPTKPSMAVLQTRGEAATGTLVTPELVSKVRGTLPQTLRRRLRGDLDTIVLTALRREPQRRYGSVEQLVDDLRRHLDNLPIKARRPTVAYRTGKFMRRHALPVFTGCVLVALILGFTTVIVRQAQQLESERDRVLEESFNARQVADFMVNLFEIPDPGEERGNSITVREILDRGAEHIEGRLEEQSEIRAALLQAMGRAYAGLGEYPKARSFMESSIAVLQSDAPLHSERAREIELAESLLELAHVSRMVGDLERAWSSIEAAREAIDTTGNTAICLSASVYEELGAVCEERLDLECAEASYLESLAMIRQGKDSPGDDGLECIEKVERETLEGMAALKYAQGKSLEALVHQKRSIELARKYFGEQHPSAVSGWSNLAILYRSLGDLEQAIGAIERCRALASEIYPPGHPTLSRALLILGELETQAGRWGDAERHLQEFLGNLQLTESSPRIEYLKALATSYLGKVDAGQGRSEASREHWEAALQLLRPVDQAFASSLRVELLLSLGRVEEARPAAEELLAQGFDRRNFRELCAKHGIFPP